MPGQQGSRRRAATVRRVVASVAVAVAAPVALGACGAASGPGARTPGVVSVVAAENEYGSVAEQIGGRYVQVDSVMSNPSTDPHAFEVNPSVARAVAGSALVIQNGLGYDTFMGRVESASPNSARKVVDVQRLLGLPDSTANPHLWYDPSTMPVVASAIGRDLAVIDPAHRGYYRASVAAFDASLAPWRRAVASFRAAHRGAAAATTEPVADYLLAAMGIVNKTPFSFQADVMNGTDPTPQDIAFEEGLLARHRVEMFAYNKQVTSALTDSIRSAAQRAGVPIVGVFETMPTPGYDYQSWMLAETLAIERAVTRGVSTPHL